MQNEFNAPDGRGEARRIRAHEEEAQPLVDREVPLVRRGLASDVHAWLDGELPETALVQGGAAREVEFWNKLGADLAVRREVKTPTHVAAQIMAALPATAPAPAVTDVEPWYAREMTVTPVKAVAVGAAIAAAAAAVTAAIVAG